MSSWKLHRVVWWRDINSLEYSNASTRMMKKFQMVIEEY
jgi:hypothetical protein